MPVPPTRNESLSLTLLTNAQVLTLDTGNPRARALLIAGKRIVEVFQEPNPDLGGTRFPVKCQDLNGAIVCPAFTDTHIHLVDWGYSLTRAELSSARSADETARLAHEHLLKNPLPKGTWVVGQGWTHNNWDDPTFPKSHRLLDTLFPDHPVVLNSKCFHIMWVNGAALRLAGVTGETPDPTGGEIERDDAGEPTGILKEEAAGFIYRAMGSSGADDLRRALDRATREAHAHGIVAVHDVETLETFRLLERANADGELGLRVSFYLPASVLNELVRAGIEAGLGDARLRIAGVKLFTDGSLGGRTAWMLGPYEGEPGNTGIPILHGDELRETVRRANAHGLSCATHAIGDRAIRETLDAYEASWQALAASADPARHARLRNRIEHFQTISPDDLPRLARFPICACMQPVHLFADWKPAGRYLGARERWTYAVKSLRDAGALVGFGSDAPVESVHVGWGMFAAVARQDLTEQPEGGWVPEERITADEALRAYCQAGPQISGDAHDRGTLAPGQRADLVILDRNPLECPTPALRDLRVEATMMDGRWVFSRGTVVEPSLLEDPSCLWKPSEAR